MKKEITSATPTIDKAEFNHLGKQVYCCKLYEGNKHKGTIPYIGGIYFNETKEWLKKIYPNIDVFKIDDVTGKA